MTASIKVMKGSHLYFLQKKMKEKVKLEFVELWYNVGYERTAARAKIRCHPFPRNPTKQESTEMTLNTQINEVADKTGAILGLASSLKEKAVAEANRSPSSIYKDARMYNLDAACQLIDRALSLMEKASGRIGGGAE